MKCPNCNKEIRKNVKYCENCGAPVSSNKTKKILLSIFIPIGAVISFIITFFGVAVIIGIIASANNPKQPAQTAQPAQTEIVEELTEPPFDIADHNICVYEDISFYYSDKYTISRSGAIEMMYGATDDSLSIFSLVCHPANDDKSLLEKYTEDLYSISERTIHENKEFDIDGNPALLQSFTFDNSYSSTVYVAYKGNDYKITCVSPVQSIVDDFIDDFINSVEFL